MLLFCSQLHSLIISPSKLNYTQEGLEKMESVNGAMSGWVMGHGEAGPLQITDGSLPEGH